MGLCLSKVTPSYWPLLRAMIERTKLGVFEKELTWTMYVDDCLRLGERGMSGGSCEYSERDVRGEMMDEPSCNRELRELEAPHVATSVLLVQWRFGFC